jgi:hypothetical protein
MDPLDLFAEDLDYRAKLVRQARISLANNAVRSRIRAIYAALKPTMEAYPEKCKLSSWSYGRSLTITLHMSSLDRFNGPEAVQLLGNIVEAAGYDEERTHDDAASVARRYHFAYDIPVPELGYVRLELNVHLAVVSESPVCYRVERGVKTVEVPEYEIVCPEPTEVPQ